MDQGLVVQSYASRAEMLAAHKARQERLWAKRKWEGRICNANIQKALAVPLRPAEGAPVRDVLVLREPAFAWPPCSRRAPTMREIIAAVSFVTGISVNDIVSCRRFKPITHARMLCYYLARKHTTLSYPQIGKVVGNRDHSTVMNGEQRVLKFMPVMASFIAEVERKLGVDNQCP